MGGEAPFALKLTENSWRTGLVAGLAVANSTWTCKNLDLGDVIDDTPIVAWGDNGDHDASGVGTFPDRVRRTRTDEGSTVPLAFSIVHVVPSDPESKTAESYQPVEANDWVSRASPMRSATPSSIV